MGRSCLLAMVLLSGCWVGPAQVAAKVSEVAGDTDDTGDTGQDWDPLVLTEVAPAVGNNRGGAQVRIQAGPLDPQTAPEVNFGGVPAEVLDHDDQSVLVRAPAIGVEGSVDVVVSSAGRTARATGGFFYWADGTGRSGLLGTVSNYDLDRGYDLSDYFGEVPPDYVSQMHSAAIIYVEPVETDYWRFYSDALDTCTRSYRYDGPSINVLKPQVSSIRLLTGGSTVLLGPDGNGEYFGLPLTDDWLPASQGLDLEQAEGGAGWVPLQVADVVTLPSTGFRVTSPAADFTLGTVDPSFELRWEGGTPGDVVLVELVRYDFLGDFQDQVTCALVDDGLHTINRSLWSNPEPIGGTVTIAVGRARVDDATLPTNGAMVGIYGVHWWYGAASFRLF